MKTYRINFDKLTPRITPYAGAIAVITLQNTLKTIGVLNVIANTSHISFSLGDGENPIEVLQRLHWNFKPSDLIEVSSENIQSTSEDEKIVKIRAAFARYRASEGCSCCQVVDKHEEAAAELGKLLNVPMYDDNSGYNFRLFKDS